MSNDKAAASFHGSGCRWGGPQTGACWNVGACGCAVAAREASERSHLSLWDRILLAVMQGPVKIAKRKKR